jgi:hypothetical protein
MTGSTHTAVLSLALEPKTAEDRVKLGRGLAWLTSEDPTIAVKTDQATGGVRRSADAQRVEYRAAGATTRRAGSLRPPARALARMASRASWGTLRYSARSAVFGSTLAARWAGSAVAASADSVRQAIAPAKARGSFASS